MADCIECPDCGADIDIEDYIEEALNDKDNALSDADLFYMVRERGFIGEKSEVEIICKLLNIIS